ncbi:MAG: hypothetical protein C5B50_16175 [Verrucomicrobia bacterium]|nr:MAG: hypothetical protein C5B50_16175 [Verrucomicrobiota bacterium]
MNPPVLPPPGPAAPRKKRRWLLIGCAGFLALVLIIVATVAITLWWMQRPIKPVVLSPEEKTAVEAKLERVQGTAPPNARSPETSESRSGKTLELDRPYVPGAKLIKLTEREINGLLNANTDLGNTVRLEFGRDAINAYLAVPIPKDFPIMGGKMFRARGRFAISVGNGGTPYAILEDVTVFGLSLPKAWLGGVKGENLLADVVKQNPNGPVLRGIKSLRVEPGALVLEVED